MDPLLDSWSPAVVFTPSQANKRNTDAKDWEYVDNWLARRFAPNTPPPFERNPQTLKTLLDLANANEKADEQARLARIARTEALKEAKAKLEETVLAEGNPLRILECCLSPEETQSLDALALVSVALGKSSGQRSEIYSGLSELKRNEASLHLQTMQLNKLIRDLQDDEASLKKSIAEIRESGKCKTPHDLPSHITEYERTTRQVRDKKAEYDLRIANLEKEWERSRGKEVRIPELIEEERQLEELKEEVLKMEAQAKGFQGLPTDKDLARLEVDRAQGELDELLRQRDELYAKMT
ncbi:hypothetical protein BJ508DRAFT_417769 [Ascobolus immersus RN42]|uniref:Uncharacterized protein n=1 Tax=Ascobolus immersus RN42 TaxID=1160509 RepID=A0A3N4HRW8_ASCIM|nr:hypothetical protein BJ508DRAFT_417769 [Ascobolus immersus RN42]